MNLPSISAHIKKHSIQSYKKLGQHFLIHENLCSKIVKIAGDITNKTVIEIGPGPGGLTRTILAQNPKILIAIEKDKQFIPLLEDIKEVYPNLTLIHGDALLINLSELVIDSDIIIISNLPYQISTVLLFQWIRIRGKIKSMTLMLQKEVADRLCAKVGNKNYGKISVIVQSIATIKTHFVIHASAFIPPPKVKSSIVHMQFLSDIEDSLLEKLQIITRAVFQQQRKMIKTTLKDCIPNTLNQLEALQINPFSRPSELSISQYISLALIY